MDEGKKGGREGKEGRMEGGKGRQRKTTQHRMQMGF